MESKVLSHVTCENSAWPLHGYTWGPTRMAQFHLFKLLGDEKDRKEGQEGVKLGPTLALVK